MTADKSVQPPFRQIAGTPQEMIAAWEAMCSACRETQEAVLTDILRHAAGSEFGRAHGFGTVTDIEGFRSAVPVSEYEDYSRMIDRMADEGAQDILFDGPTGYFTSTSGTTGRPKLIPESGIGAEAKSAAVRLRNLYIGKVFAKAAASRRFARALASKGIDPKKADAGAMSAFSYFPLASAIEGTRTKAGIEVTFASGKTFDSTASSDGLAYPREVMGLNDGEAVMYLSMLFSMAKGDVITVAGNNAGRMVSRIRYAQDHAESIIRDIRDGTISESIDIPADVRASLEARLHPDPERADVLQGMLDSGRECLVPANYWPYVMTAGFWLSGSVGSNVDALRPMLGDVLLFDVGYGASEAKINIPMEEGVGYGALAIATAFYEFLPMDGGGPLLAHELSDGGEYELLLTTYSGLYRYNLHDIVKVRGFTGNTPNIEFVTKSREILDVAQEKVPAPAMLDIVRRELAAMGMPVCQAQVWPDLQDHRYEIYAEPDSEWTVPSDLSSVVDGIIRRAFPMYERNRGLGALEEAKVIVMRRGWQEHLFRSKDGGGPSSQVKLESLAKERPGREWMSP